MEVFEHALENTPGNDLARVLWLKSRSSEVWLDRRTTYTRSLAVMSMVGYLLGLGDRHPSNLMLDRYSGKILHIDFGDCFEASMHREKFPERVPFRLTRMLVRAMEVSGIEGNFRSTCEGVMQVLRGNKDSVMAMLEAFVHDPLINWRLLNTTAPGETANEYAGAGVMSVSAVHTSSNAPTPTATPGPAPADGSNPAEGEHGQGGANPNAGANPSGAGGANSAQKPSTPPMPSLAEETSAEAAAEEEATAAARARAAGLTQPAPHHPGGAPVDVGAVDGSSSLAPEASDGSSSLAAAAIPVPTAPDAADVDARAVYAAASELQRGRVTALDAVEGLNVDANEVLNDRAVSVMRRMSHKLTGRDGSPGSALAAAPGAGATPSPGAAQRAEDVDNATPDGVEAQVQRLIVSATSHENLCQSYIGWCPFW